MRSEPAITQLTIGQVSKQSGVGIETIRFYERKGLLKDPPRRASGYRIYTDEAIRVLRFIKQAQKLGFTLTEIQEFLALRETNGAACEEIQEIAQRKVREIERKIRDLTGMRQALDTLLESCKQKDDEHHCPILEAFESDHKESQL